MKNDINVNESSSIERNEKDTNQEIYDSDYSQDSIENNLNKQINSIYLSETDENESQEINEENSNPVHTEIVDNNQTHQMIRKQKIKSQIKSLNQEIETLTDQKEKLKIILELIRIGEKNKIIYESMIGSPLEKCEQVYLKNVSFYEFVIGTVRYIMMLRPTEFGSYARENGTDSIKWAIFDEHYKQIKNEDVENMYKEIEKGYLDVPSIKNYKKANKKEIIYFLMHAYKIEIPLSQFFELTLKD